MSCVLLKLRKDAKETKGREGSGDTWCLPLGAREPGGCLGRGQMILRPLSKESKNPSRFQTLEIRKIKKNGKVSEWIRKHC